MQNLMGMMPGPFGQSEPLWKTIVTNSAGASECSDHKLNPPTDYPLIPTNPKERINE